MLYGQRFLPLSCHALWSGRRVSFTATRQCRLVDIFRFPVIGQKRSCYAQCRNFFLQPRHLKLFLSQNFVNVLHASTPLRNGVNCGQTTGQNNRVRQRQSSQPKNSVVVVLPTCCADLNVLWQQRCRRCGFWQGAYIEPCLTAIRALRYSGLHARH
jgi:hypothetical protein